MDSQRVERSVFRPFHSNLIDLRNRLVMAPMTRAKADHGVLPEESVAYYRRRAESGVALIISEGTWIDHSAASDRRAVPTFHGEAALARWKQVIDAVHAAGGKMFPQLWHIGGIADRSQAFNPDHPAVSPSGISAAGATDASHRALTSRDIDEIVDAYATAAADAHRLGFDGVELHGGHGFLIDQFFWSVTNQRDDHYNGSLVDRTRFAAEIVKECKLRTHNEFPISLRFSQWKMGNFGARLFDHENELAAFVEALAGAGVDVFSCSTRRHWDPAFPGSDLTLAGWTKKLSGKPTIAVGGIGVDEGGTPETNGEPGLVASIERAVERLERDEYDLIAVGRAILADPHWVDKTKRADWNSIKPFSEDIRHVMY